MSLKSSSEMRCDTINSSTVKKSLPIKLRSRKKSSVLLRRQKDASVLNARREKMTDWRSCETHKKNGRPRKSARIFLPWQKKTIALNRYARKSAQRLTRSLNRETLPLNFSNTAHSENVSTRNSVESNEMRISRPRETAK